MGKTFEKLKSWPGSAIALAALVSCSQANVAMQKASPDGASASSVGEGNGGRPGGFVPLPDPRVAGTGGNGGGPDGSVPGTGGKGGSLPETDAGGKGGSANGGVSSDAGGKDVAAAGKDVASAPRIDAAPPPLPGANPAANLDKFRFDYNCGDRVGTKCNPGSVCFYSKAYVNKRFAQTIPITIGGDAAVIYEVTLRIRGIMEPKAYPTCTPVTMAPGGDSFITICAGSTAGTETYNTWQLTVANPPATFFLNYNKKFLGHVVSLIDANLSIKVRGGSQVEFTVDDVNGGQIRNCSLVVPDLAPAPAPFDGNFVHFDVIDVKPAK